MTDPVFSAAPVPADICTGRYFYKRACDGAWMAAWPGQRQPGTTFQSGSAHTWSVVGEDGREFAIADQDNGSNPGAKTYAKPPATNPSALAWWERCYITEPPDVPGGYARTCNKLYPGGMQDPALVTLAQVADPSKRASWEAQFGCAGPGPQPPSDKTFCPKDYITRQQVAALLYNLAKWQAAHPGQVPPVPVEQQFSDVPMDSAFRPAIDALAAAGIVAGKSPCVAP